MFLEGNMNLDGLVILIGLIMFGPALILVVIGVILNSKEKKKAAKILFILAAIYVVVSLGVCGSLIG